MRKLTDDERERLNLTAEYLSRLTPKTVDMFYPVLRIALDTDFYILLTHEVTRKNPGLAEELKRLWSERSASTDRP